MVEFSLEYITEYGGGNPKKSAWRLVTGIGKKIAIRTRENEIDMDLIIRSDPSYASEFDEGKITIEKITPEMAPCTAGSELKEIEGVIEYKELGMTSSGFGHETWKPVGDMKTKNFKLKISSKKGKLFNKYLIEKGD
ncbi:MAG: hypothetical protein HZB68_05005 [Candidatus Aenigmarchaeota archaeon]|nr:hypothetical protein [Candidatus Aenigmarchaeota archaeon]